MNQTLDLLQAVQDVVLNPTFGTAVALFLISFLNELVAIFPFAVLLAGQLLFLQSGVSIALFIKLLLFVALPVGLGSALGVIPIYVLAYFGGKPAIEKFQKYLRFSWGDVEKVTSRFKGEWYDEVIFLLLRSIPVLPSFPVSIAAGILRMPFVPYLSITIVGFVIRMMLTLLVIGMGMHSLSQF
jgi:membrane protein DedA with SNARE-associated domain